MTRHSNLLWITALALGWMFDLLFWKQSFGLNFAIFSVACLAGGLIVLVSNGQRPSGGAILLVALILVFAGVTLLRMEAMTLFLGILFTLLLLGLLAGTFLGGRWLSYGLLDYLGSLARLGGSMLVRPVMFESEVRREQAASGLAPRKFKPWPVLRGVVLALPIVALFAALLAAADAVFSHELDAVVTALSLENLPEYIFRLVYILFLAYSLAGAILHASAHSRDEQLAAEGDSLLRFLGFTESAIVLGSVAVLFGAFVAVQFRYFFGGQANISLSGFTYAEYARRGFGELVTVAFFSLLLILGLAAVTRRDSGWQRRSFSALSALIVALVMVMLVSAYQRLMLYESAYGFSRLRTYTHVSLVWIGLLLISAVVLEIVRRQRLFAAAFMLASLGFALSLAAVNVDGLIVRQNVVRSAQGKELDVSYLSSLSPDAVPDVVNAFQSAATPAGTRDALGAVLACRGHREADKRSGDWRSFTLSGWRAQAALAQVRGRLAGYRVVDDPWPVHVVSPAGQSYDCYGPRVD